MENLEQKIDPYLTIFEYMRENTGSVIVQTDLIRHLGAKHGMSYYKAWYLIAKLYAPTMAQDGDIVMPMLIKKFSLERRGALLVLDLHDEWKKVTTTEARDILHNILTPFVQR